MRKVTSLSLDQQIMKELEEIVRRREAEGRRTNKSRVIEEAFRKSRAFL